MTPSQPLVAGATKKARNKVRALAHRSEPGSGDHACGGRQELGVHDRSEAYYEAANANAEEDAELSLAEVAWAVGMTREDAKRTANEEALLAEIRKLETAQAA